MAVADEERVVVADIAGRQRHAPDAVGQPFRMPDLGIEGDERAQAEMVAIVRHVLGDMGVVGIVGQMRIAQHDREVVELQALLGGIDVERSVGGGAAVLVLEYPVAADPIAHLEAIERHALVLERLGHRQPADAGADDASLGELRHPNRPNPFRGWWITPPSSST